MVKVNFIFYLNLNLNRKIETKLNLTYTRPFMRDQSSFFRRKSILKFDNFFAFETFKCIE